MESADSAFKNQAGEFAREEPNEYLMALEPFSSELTFHMTRADSRVMQIFPSWITTGTAAPTPTAISPATL